MQLLISFLIIISLLALRSSARLLVFLQGSDPASFFANLFLYFYESKCMNELKKHDLIKAGKPCNIFRFIDDFKSVMVGNLKVVTLISILRNYSQLKKKLINLRPVFLI